MFVIGTDLRVVENLSEEEARTTEVEVAETNNEVSGPLYCVIVL